MKKGQKLITFKGFGKDLKCRGFQYKIGKTFKEDTAECCQSGFHACSIPLSVFYYYPPAESRYAVVEQSGKLHKNEDKVASTKIKIKDELSLFELVKAQIEWVNSQLYPNKKEDLIGYQGAAAQTSYQGAAIQTGDQGAAVQTGGQGAAVQTGYQGAAAQTSYQGAAAQTGDRGAAVQTGYRGAAVQTGLQGAAVQTGGQGAAVQTGYRGSATYSGDYGMSVSLGINSKACILEGKGAIVIQDWRLDDKGDFYVHSRLLMAIGDRLPNSKEKMKHKVWYWFEDGILRSEKQ